MSCDFCVKSCDLYFSINRDDIIKAFKHLAIQLHPDKNAAPGSEEAFKLVSHAKDELLKTL